MNNLSQSARSYTPYICRMAAAVRCRSNENCSRLQQMLIFQLFFNLKTSRIRGFITLFFAIFDSVNSMRYQTAVTQLGLSLKSASRTGSNGLSMGFSQLVISMQLLIFLSIQMSASAYWQAGSSRTTSLTSLMFSLQIRLRFLYILVMVVLSARDRLALLSRCPFRISCTAWGRYFWTGLGGSTFGLGYGDERRDIHLQFTIFINNTLMLYDASRDDETSSDCSECKREGVASNHHDQPEHQYARGAQSSPKGIRTEAMNSNARNDSIDLLHLLQEEVRKLKFLNQEQQREIKELRYELSASRAKKYLSPEFVKSTRDIPRHIKQSLSSNRIGRVFSPEPKGYESRQRGTILQTLKLQREVKEYQLKTVQLNDCLKEYEQNLSWMNKFVDRFVQMSEELNVTYGGLIELRGCSLRKKAKMSWRYLKDLINYLIR